MVRIAAFGGSAGSFEVFCRILPWLPPGPAYVFVTHLPRTHVSAIPKLFSRFTTMKVHCADSRGPVQANSLYVLAPHTFLYLREDGLAPQPRAQGAPNRAINYFFESLCAVQGNQAIGILLSGGGHDGKAGCQCIRASGGLTLAQNPQTAAFGTMPRHAIQAGAICEVLEPEAIPTRLAQLLADTTPLARVS